jgi:signal transduction histidine kinase
MSRILMLLACGLWLFGCAGAAHADSVTAAELRGASFRVAVLRDFPPLYMEDSQGRPTGFAIELLEAIAAEAGFSIEYIASENWGTAAQLIRDKEADIVPGYGINDYRLAEFDFTVPMESIPVRVFVKKGDRRIRRIEDLANPGFTTAVINEGAAHVELRQRGGYHLTLENNVDEGLNALLAGSVDAFIFPEPVLLQKLRSMGLEGFVVTVDEPLLILKRGYLFRSGDEHLESFNRILSELVGSSFYAGLLKKWYGEPEPFWTIKKAVALMFIFAGVTVILLVLWKHDSVRRVNKKLRRSEAHLAAKNRELEQLVYVASHDLRSPLVNVDGFSRELEYSLKDIGALLEKDDTDHAIIEQMLRAEFPDMLQSLERIRGSVRQMDVLIKGLLKLSRSGRTVLQIETIDMNGLLQELAGSFAYRIKEAGMELGIDALPSCLGDASQITQIFANLIDNAIKYRDKSRPGRIDITGTANKEWALYRVEDNGIGIAENHQANIFELFHQLNPGSEDGEGLGLTAVKQILGRLDGDIRVESQPGIGSVFIVTLPAVAKRYVKG